MERTQAETHPLLIPRESVITVAFSTTPNCSICCRRSSALISKNRFDTNTVGFGSPGSSTYRNAPLAGAFLEREYRPGPSVPSGFTFAVASASACASGGAGDVPVTPGSGLVLVLVVVVLVTWLPFVPAIVSVPVSISTSILPSPSTGVRNPVSDSPTAFNSFPAISSPPSRLRARSLFHRHCCRCCWSRCCCWSRHCGGWRGGMYTGR